VWRVTRQNNLSGEPAGATDVDPAGGFADADLRAPAPTPQSVVNGIAQFNGTFPASFERGVNASVAASPADTSPTSLDASAPILHGGTSATSLFASAAIVHGSTGAAGIGPNGATPAQVRQAVNAATLATNGAGITVGVMSSSFNQHTWCLQYCSRHVETFIATPCARVGCRPANRESRAEKMIVVLADSVGDYPSTLCCSSSPEEASHDRSNAPFFAVGFGARHRVGGCTR
jgi:hypothetical protein